MIGEGTAPDDETGEVEPGWAPPPADGGSPAEPRPADEPLPTDEPTRTTDETAATPPPVVEASADDEPSADDGPTAGEEPEMTDRPAPDDRPIAEDEPIPTDEPALADDEPAATDEPAAPDEPWAAEPTPPDAPPVTAEPEEPRGTALDLAGLHLRLGSLALARSELEMLAGRGGLDAAGRVDLAEARWRSGDLVGGGDAAREALAGGRETVVALVVASEAAAALGRPSEARRLAGQALTLNGGAIDPIFRGMPRSSVWPADPAEPVPSAATLFPPDRADAAFDADRDEALAAADLEREDPEAIAMAAPAIEPDAPPAEPGLWDLHEAAALAAGASVPGPSDLDPPALFDEGRAALESGDLATAAVQLGLVVRLAPALAPAVLSIIGDPVDAGMLLVQGDAYRAVGHETEAKRAYAAAMGIATTAPEPTPAEPEEPPPPRAEPPPSAWWLQALAEPDAPVQPEPLPEPIDASDEPGSTFEVEPPVGPPGPPEPDRDSGWHNDEGAWRADQDEWRDDDR
jgi:hypothetical protein